MRKASKFEIFYSITLILIGLFLMFTEYKEWSSPVVFSVLAIQQSKNYVHFRGSNVEALKKKAKSSLYSFIIVSCSTALMIVVNLYSKTIQ